MDVEKLITCVTICFVVKDWFQMSLTLDLNYEGLVGPDQPEEFLQDCKQQQL